MVRTTVVADFEAFFSRPVAPTRRIAVGELRIPAAMADRRTSASVAAASMLLGGVLATFAPALDEDDTGELHRLIDDVDSGRRIPQPRLRHRLQVDRVGLKRSTNRLLQGHRSRSDTRSALELEVDRTNGTATQQCLAAVYCAMPLAESSRSRVCAALRLGLVWAGTPGEDLLAVLRVGAVSGNWWGGSGSPSSVAADPVSWALELLGLPEPSDPGESVQKRTVQRAFRTALRDAHPDHGAPIDGAAQRISELNTARRILLG